MARSLSPILPLVAALVAFAVAVAGLLASPSSADAAGQLDAQIADMAFQPGNLVVQIGDTVTWTNNDDRPHTVTSDDGSFDSGNVDQGGTFSFTFKSAGTFTYHCDYHSDMRATVTVQAAPTAPAGQADATGDGGSDHGAAADHAAGNSEPGSTADQPDTALPAPSAIPNLSWVLWGLGLIALAITVLPAGKRVSAASHRPIGGWRR